MPTLISLAGGQEAHVVVEESAEEVRKLIREARAEGLVRPDGGPGGSLGLDQPGLRDPGPVRVARIIRCGRRRG